MAKVLHVSLCVFKIASERIGEEYITICPEIRDNWTSIHVSIYTYVPELKCLPSMALIYRASNTYAAEEELIRLMKSQT